MHSLHEALEGVRRIVEHGARINPQTLRATVVIAASDYVQYALLARYSVALRAEAPMIRIAWRALDVMALTTQLERGQRWPASLAGSRVHCSGRQRWQRH